MTTETAKLTGLLGLAKRAGRIAVGYDAALSAVKSNKAILAVCANDLSSKTMKEWQFSAKTIALLPLPIDKDTLGSVIGLAKPVGILAICDQGFADAILKCIPNDKEELQ